jgi:hypothetical protein
MRDESEKWRVERSSGHLTSSLQPLASLNFKLKSSSAKSLTLQGEVGGGLLNFNYYGTKIKKNVLGTDC